MKTCLVYKFDDAKSGELILLDADLNILDSYTSRFENAEHLVSDDRFADKVGAFIYDNVDFLEDSVEPKLMVRYRLEAEDVNMLRSFMNVSGRKDIYLPVVFQDDVVTLGKLENFIKDNAFPYGLFF